MVHPSSPGADLELHDRMVAFVRAFGLHRPETTPCGQPVSVSEAHAVVELARGDGLTQHELSARLRLEKSTVSRLVGQLAARGWLERGPNPRDGRSVRLRLTPAGSGAAGRITQARRARFASLLAAIPEGERANVLAALGTLTEALHATEPEPT